MSPMHVTLKAGVKGKSLLKRVRYERIKKRSSMEIERGFHLSVEIYFVIISKRSGEDFKPA